MFGIRCCLSLCCSSFVNDVDDMICCDFLYSLLSFVIFCWCYVGLLMCYDGFVVGVLLVFSCPVCWMFFCLDGKLLV